MAPRPRIGISPAKTAVQPSPIARTTVADRDHRERGKDPHLQAALRREGWHLADRHRAARHRVEAEALEQHRRDQLHLGLAESLADADSPAAAEGNVGAARQSGLALAGEALGDEGLGVGEDLGDAVARPGAVVDVGALGDRVAAELELADRPAGADPGGRVEAQHLVEDHVEVGHLALQLVDRRGRLRRAPDPAPPGGGPARRGVAPARAS